MVRFGWLKDALIKASMPFYLIWLTINLVIIRKPEVNGYKTAEIKQKLTVHKNVAFVPDIETDLLKRRAKELSTDGNKFTLNDILITAISKTIHDFLQTNTEDRTTKQTIMACPFSLRRPPEALNDFEFDNNFAIVPLQLRLIDNMKTGIKLLNQDMNALKKSIEPIGLVYLIKIVMQLPEFLRAFILEDFCDKMTFGFSNVPGPKKTFVTAGYRAQSLGFIMPVGKSIVGSFSIISHADVVKVGVTMDKAVMKDPKIIMKTLLENLDEVLGGEKWRDYGKQRGIK